MCTERQKVVSGLDNLTMGTSKDAVRNTVEKQLKDIIRKVIYAMQNVIF